MLRLKKRHTENIIKEYIKVIKLSDYMLKWNGKQKEYIKIHNHSINIESLYKSREVININIRNKDEWMNADIYNNKQRYSPTIHPPSSLNLSSYFPASKK